MFGEYLILITCCRCTATQLLRLEEYNPVSGEECLALEVMDIASPVEQPSLSLAMVVLRFVKLWFCLSSPVSRPKRFYLQTKQLLYKPRAENSTNDIAVHPLVLLGGTGMAVSTQCWSQWSYPSP